MHDDEFKQGEDASPHRLTRRGVLASAGAFAWLSSGGASGAVADARVEASPSTARADSDGSTTTRALAFPYQLAPGARFTVVESELSWTPGQLDSAYRTHVIRYDHAPSLRAFVFAPGEAGLDVGRTYAFGTMVASAEAGRRLVGVEVDAIETG